MSKSHLPFVSVITPTYNRKLFIPYLVEVYKQQTYPKTQMEWIVYDDGPESVETLFLSLTKDLPNIRYIREEEKSTIGTKRNRLNKEAKGSIIVAMDDDDYYPPTRVEHVVKQFQKQPKIELAGASEVYMLHTDNKEMVRLGPYGPTHATNGTMAWRKSYANNHFYNEDVTHSEEVSFLEKYIHPMIQLEPLQTMLIISHKENTFSKGNFRADGTNPFVRKTTYKPRDFIKDAKLREFYTSVLTS
jgi:glycosyltransferase involved in cell wall biosynthesis